MKREKEKKEAEARIVREKAEKERKEREALERRRAKEAELKAEQERKRLEAEEKVRREHEKREAQLFYKNRLEEEIEKIVLSAYSDRNRNAIKVIFNVFRKKETHIQTKIGADQTVSSFKNEIKKVKTIKQQQSTKKRLVFVGIIIAFIGALVGTCFGIKGIANEVNRKNTYENSIVLMKSGDYSKAKESFESLGDYKESKNKIIVCDGLIMLKNSIQTKDENDAINGIKKIITGGESVHVYYNSSSGREVRKMGLSHANAQYEEIISSLYFALYKPNNNLNTGYTFDHWHSDKVKYEDMTMLYLDSFWSFNAYSISYNLDGGTNSPLNPSTYTIEDSVVLRNPSREGYSFLGWHDGDETIASIPQGSVKNYELTAYWDANKYIITLDPNSGTVDKVSINATYDSDYSLPIPKRDYYIFEGWYDSFNQKWTGGKYCIANDVNLVAKWTPSAFTITYNLHGGTNDTTNPGFYTIEDEVELAAPSRFAYVFSHWSNNGNPIDKIEKGTTGDLVLEANWNPLLSPEDYDFEIVDNKELIITKYKGNASHLIIPEGVTSLGNSAFKDCTSLLSVVVPTTVSSISYGCFSGCFSLGYISLPFVGLTNASSTTDQKSTVFGTIFGSASYSGSVPVRHSNYTSAPTYYLPSKLKHVEIKSGQILSCSFYNCTLLASLSLGNGVSSIRTDAFYDCHSLASISISNNLTNISAFAFSNCSSLTTIYYSGTQLEWNSISVGEYNDFFLKANVIYNSNVSYDYCKNEKYSYSQDNYNNVYGLSLLDKGLQTFEFENTFKQKNSIGISSEAFANCSTMTSIVLPKNVTSIGKNAFVGCNSLESLTIPFVGGASQNWSEFGYFFGAGNSYQHKTCVPSSLKTLTIDGKYPSSIGSQALYECNSITTLNIGDSVTFIGRYAVYQCTALTVVNIGDGVSAFDYGAFYGCSSLSTLNIGSGVQEIGEIAFSNCSSLSYISYNGTKQQWHSIKKGTDWKHGIATATVHCLDGDVNI